MKRDFTIGIIGLGFVLVSLTDASAATFKQTHPRRAEVNHRLAMENARIHRNVVEGKITPQEAATLHKEVHGVRTQERLDASLNNGHITKAEQRALNQNENAISKQIHQAAH
jgi:hypothetical protein